MRSITTCIAVLAIASAQPSVSGHQLYAQDTLSRTAQNNTIRTSTAVPGRQSWTSDRRDFKVGDIVTILVDEYTLTSLDKRVDATDNRRRDMNLGASTPTSRQAIGVASASNSSSQNRGTDARSNRVATEMSARVTEIGENGIMKLEGVKTINIERSKIRLALSGWARPQDVYPNNAIQSVRLADASLDYQAEGPLGSPKGNIISRLLGKLWP